MTTSTPPLRDSYEAIHQRARQAANAGNLSHAIDLYRQLADRLGRLSARIMDRRPELRELWTQARAELADVLEFEGRYAEAMEVTESLQATNPERADEWRGDLAVLRVAQGDIDRGLAELRTLAEEQPDDVWRWIELGAQARTSGRLPDSEAALARAVEVGDPEDAENLAVAYHQRFLLFKELGRLDAAVEAWEQAAALDEKTRFSIRAVYALLTDAGRYTEALEYVARDENPLPAGLQRGIIARRTGKMEQARQAWQGVADLNPFDYEYGHDAWAEAALRVGDPDRAIEQLQHLLPRYGTPRLLILSGIAWAMRGDAPLAGSLFQQAIGAQRYARPVRKKLDSADWHLLDALVDAEQTKAPLKTYFAVVETVWGSSSAPQAREGGPARVLRP